MEFERMNSIKNIQSLSINPFLISRFIQSYLTGYGQIVVPFNLIYLVMPLIYYKPSRSLLLNAKSTSTLYSLFKGDSEKVVALGGIQERLFYFKNNTNQAIVVAVNEGKIIIEGDCIRLLKEVTYKKIKDVEIRNYYRAAFYLGKMTSHMDYVNVFRFFGVKKI